MEPRHKQTYRKEEVLVDEQPMERSPAEDKENVNDERSIASKALLVLGAIILWYGYNDASLCEPTHHQPFSSPLSLPACLLPVHQHKRGNAKNKPSNNKHLTQTVAKAARESHTSPTPQPGNVSTHPTHHFACLQHQTGHACVVKINRRC